MGPSNELAAILRVVSYDAETGELTWLQRPARRCKLGGRAGTISNGRRYVTIAGRKYACARLAWWIATGKQPEQFIDHIDGDMLNDRLANLRDVSPRVNVENTHRAKSHNKTGVLGVRRDGPGYMARITVLGTEIHLGSYETADEAHQAYLKAKRLMHEGCTI